MWMMPYAFCSVFRENAPGDDGVAGEARLETALSISEVRFGVLDDAEIRRYVDNRETDGQGRGIWHSGVCRLVCRGAHRQLYRGHGLAALRDRPPLKRFGYL